MKLVACPSCGSKDLEEDGEYQVCLFCRSRLIPQADDLPKKKSQIGVSSDITNLLNKCENDPDNRHRYINLILDIDPTNQEVHKYI